MTQYNHTSYFIHRTIAPMLITPITTQLYKQAPSTAHSVTCANIRVRSRNTLTKLKDFSVAVNSSTKQK
jgi:hypothetical protein